jgi:hypothetical protein
MPRTHEHEYLCDMLRHSYDISADEASNRPFVFWREKGVGRMDDEHVCGILARLHLEECRRVRRHTFILSLTSGSYPPPIRV